MCLPEISVVLLLLFISENLKNTNTFHNMCLHNFSLIQTQLSLARIWYTEFLSYLNYNIKYIIKILYKLIKSIIKYYTDKLNTKY